MSGEGWLWLDVREGIDTARGVCRGSVGCDHDVYTVGVDVVLCVGDVYCMFMLMCMLNYVCLYL